MIVFFLYRSHERIHWHWGYCFIFRRIGCLPVQTVVECPGCPQRLFTLEAVCCRLQQGHGSEALFVEARPVRATRREEMSKKAEICKVLVTTKLASVRQYWMQQKLAARSSAKSSQPPAPRTKLREWLKGVTASTANEQLAEARERLDECLAERHSSRLFTQSAVGLSVAYSVLVVWSIRCPHLWRRTKGSIQCKRYLRGKQKNGEQEQRNWVTRCYWQGGLASFPASLTCYQNTLQNHSAFHLPSVSVFIAQLRRQCHSPPRHTLMPSYKEYGEEVKKKVHRLFLCTLTVADRNFWDCLSAVAKWRMSASLNIFAALRPFWHCVVRRVK